MICRFEVDPSAVKEALLEGRKLWVEVYSPTIYRVTVGEPSAQKKIPSKGHTL